ncbi:MAG: hypothetical protein ACLTOV_10660 [Phocaeicola sp.]
MAGRCPFLGTTLTGFVSSIYVGRVWNNQQYRHKGQTFEIGQHGFARDMDFELIHHSEQAVHTACQALLKP